MDPMYNEYIGFYLNTRNYLPLEKHLDAICKKYKLNSILDVGSGDGTVAKFLYDKGYNVDSIDNSKVMVKKAKENNKGPNYYLSSFEEFESKRKYDLIAFTYTVMSYLDFFDTLDKAKKMLNKHGRIYVDLPNVKRFIDSGNFKKTQNFYTDLKIEINREIVKEETFSYVLENWKYLDLNKTKNIKHMVVDDNLKKELNKDFNVDLDYGYGNKEKQGRIQLILGRK